MEDQNSNQLEPASVFDYFRKAIQIVKLHQPTMLEVARDPNALRFGIPVTAIGGALAFIPGQNLDAVLVGALFSILVLFLFTAFVHLLCGYSKGKQEYMGFLQIIAVAGIIDWAVIIPLVGPLITIWSVVVSVSAAREVYQLTRAKAIFAVLISAMILWAVSLMIFTGPLARFYDIPTSRERMSLSGPNHGSSQKKWISDNCVSWKDCVISSSKLQMPNECPEPHANGISREGHFTIRL